MTQPDAARVERGPITEKARFKPLSDEEINDLWEGVYFTLGMAALLERQGFTVAANELRRLHAENERLRAQRDALLEALKYHQEQTRPIQRTIDAIAKAEENT